jgi:hypothetical protein
MRWLIASVAVLTTLAATLLGWSGIHTILADANRPQDYLALGDSVAFGYSPLLNFGNAANFIGYPDTADATLKQNLTNASCPGETSGHFIDLTASDNNCGLYRHSFPLHVAYSGTQLAFADGFLQSHPDTLVVSITIGANDLFVLIHSCGGSTTPAEITCIQAGLPAMLQTLGANLDIIYGHIRTVDGYHHKLVGLTYYALNYGDPVGTQITAAVNQVVADRTQAWSGIVADGFGAFEAASAAFGGDTCAAGSRIVLVAAPLTCDVHPTPAGRDLLAQAIVNALRTD